MFSWYQSCINEKDFQSLSGGEGGGRSTAKAPDEAHAESATNQQHQDSPATGTPADLKSQSWTKLTSSLTAESDQDGGKASSTESLRPGPVSQTGSKKTMQERRQQQLKLINERLAKRYSKLPRKETSPHSAKISADLDNHSSANKTTHPANTSPSLVKNPSDNPSAVNKTTHSVNTAPHFDHPSSPVNKKVTHFDDPSSLINKTTHSVNVSPNSVKCFSHLDRAMHSATYGVVDKSIQEPSTSKTAYKLSSLFPTDFSPASHHAKLGAVFSIDDPLPAKTSAASQSDLLESESSFLPVLSSGDMSQKSQYHATGSVSVPTGEWETESSYVNSLLSSFDSAYGYSSLTDKSRLLSTLVVGRAEGGPARSNTDELVGVQRQHDPSSSSSSSKRDLNKEATLIQAVCRGYLARKRFKVQCKTIRAAVCIQAMW